MENLFDDSEQNIVEPVVEPELNNKPARRLFSRRNIIIAVVVVAVLVVGYFGKGLLVAATVDGSPISRWSVISKLERGSGANMLDSLITEKLITNELSNKKVVITEEETNTEIKKVEDKIVAQGGTLDQALELQGMTRADFVEQIKIKLGIAKILGDQIQTTDAEVAKYIKDNKLTVAKGQTLVQLNEQVREQVRSGKFNEAAQAWLDTLRTQASVRRWVSY